MDKYDLLEEMREWVDEYLENCDEPESYVPGFYKAEVLWRDLCEKSVRGDFGNLGVHLEFQADDGPEDQACLSYLKERADLDGESVTEHNRIVCWV